MRKILTGGLAALMLSVGVCAWGCGGTPAPPPVVMTVDTTSEYTSFPDILPDPPETDSNCNNGVM